MESGWDQRGDVDPRVWTARFVRTVMEDPEDRRMRCSSRCLAPGGQEILSCRIENKGYKAISYSGIKIKNSGKTTFLEKGGEDRFKKTPVLRQSNEIN